MKKADNKAYVWYISKNVKTHMHGKTKGTFPNIF